jgi:hypothetical protein
MRLGDVLDGKEQGGDCTKRTRSESQNFVVGSHYNTTNV